ncbi:unnamed protein product [Gongylonema pulchrum]|uniref:Uncharacterized protein n=1 Tax=Gongylonema pulchrum TaxID=637853 RepID=A0A183DKI7_9BILA|nr:unnamed protein product [Gongylonema pulchrum]
MEDEANSQYDQSLTIDANNALCSSENAGFFQRAIAQNPKQLFSAEQPLDLSSHSHYHTEQNPRYQKVSVQNYLLPSEDSASIVTNEQQNLPYPLLRKALQQPSKISYAEVLRRNYLKTSDVQQKLQNILSTAQLSLTGLGDVETEMPSTSKNLRKVDIVLDNSGCSEKIGCRDKQLFDSSPDLPKSSLFERSHPRFLPATDPEVALDQDLIHIVQAIMQGIKRQKFSTSSSSEAVSEPGRATYSWDAADTNISDQENIQNW